MLSLFWSRGTVFCFSFLTLSLILPNKWAVGSQALPILATISPEHDCLVPLGSPGQCCYWYPMVATGCTGAGLAAVFITHAGYLGQKHLEGCWSSRRGRAGCCFPTELVIGEQCLHIWESIWLCWNFLQNSDKLFFLWKYRSVCFKLENPMCIMLFLLPNGHNFLLWLEEQSVANKTEEKSF